MFVLLYLHGSLAAHFSAPSRFPHPLSFCVEICFSPFALPESPSRGKLHPLAEVLDADSLLDCWSPIPHSFSRSRPRTARKARARRPAQPHHRRFFPNRDVSQPELSPDGLWVAYAVRTRLLKDDKSEQRLWMVGTRGGDPIPLTADAVSSTHPRWSPDGKYLSFLSARNGAKNQVWLLDRRGGEGQRLTDVAQGVNDFEWSPDSTHLVPHPPGSQARR